MTVAQVASQPMIYIVEDDAAVRHSLSFLLESCGFSVTAYGTATEFLDAGDPHGGCLVVDYHLPRMSGLDLLNLLHQRHVDLPAILITGKVDPSIRQEAAGRGVIALLEKPFDDDDLVAAIERALT